MDSLLDSHWFHLASQGNIYSLAQLCSNKGTNKVLLSSLERKIYLCEYVLAQKNRIKPHVKELLFTYIPSKAEIISIDAYNKSTKREGKEGKEDEFVIGITLVKPNNEVGKPNNEAGMETYLNIYTEGATNDGDENDSLEALAQNCLILQLSYTPYHLYHTTVPQSSGNEIVWLLSGSDKKIHMIQEHEWNHVYTEKQIEKYFPEFDDLQAITLWMDVLYYNDYKQRITAVATECGLVQISVVNMKNVEIEKSWCLRYEDPICSVKIFPHFNYITEPSFIQKKASRKKPEDSINIVVANTNISVVFRDVVNKGLDFDEALTVPKDVVDTILCSCIADINMDGRNEILLGTYSQQVLMFAEKNDTWQLVDQKLFSSPVHSICYLDLVGDGVKELIVLTQQGVHLLRHDPDVVMDLWKKNLMKLSEREDL